MVEIDVMIVLFMFAVFLSLLLNLRSSMDLPNPQNERRVAACEVADSSDAYTLLGSSHMKYGRTET